MITISPNLANTNLNSEFSICMFSIVPLQDDEDDEDYNQLNKDKTEPKPTKKKKVTSVFGLGYFGRFLNLFS